MYEIHLRDYFVAGASMNITILDPQFSLQMLIKCTLRKSTTSNHLGVEWYVEVLVTIHINKDS